MERAEPDQVKVTILIGARVISVILLGSGNSRHINGYYEIRREAAHIQLQSEVLYLIIPTRRIK